MAFGFFKKTQAADIIFKNGNIYTHDPDFPWAEAVACTDGKITAVGDFDAMNNMTERTPKSSTWAASICSRDSSTYTEALS